MISSYLREELSATKLKWKKVMAKYEMMLRRQMVIFKKEDKLLPISFLIYIYIWAIDSSKRDERQEVENDFKNKDYNWH